MAKNNTLISNIAALLLAFVGVIAMIYAWFVLLTTGSHDYKIAAIELIGVVFGIIGYFLWKYNHRSCKSPESEYEK